MASDQLIARYPSPDDKRWIELRQQPGGLFYFQEFYEATDTVPVYGSPTYPIPGLKSGLYHSAAAAEADMQKTVPWLSEQSR